MLSSLSSANANANANANAADRRTGSLTSAAHRSTVKELTYLVLVNYADLLTCGCCCTPPPPVGDKSATLLDRGTIRVLPALKTATATATATGSTCLNCCWGGETEEGTKRLALVAYCDASELDRSDPTLWLKIACAARSLGRIVFANKVQTISTSSTSDDESGDDYYLNHTPSPAMLDYHRLERYALESGLSCLPPGAPPNRAIVRAYRELQAQSDVTKVPTYLPVRAQQSETPSIVIDLPRYSWSVAGRVLMRAFRLGGAFVDHEAAALMSFPASNARRRAADETEYFGSASIDIRISPVLILPVGVLGTVCEYIEREGGGISRDIMNFESSCRALSSDIVSARAMAEKARRQRRTDAERKMLKKSVDEKHHENNKIATNDGACTTEGKSEETVARGEEKEKDEDAAKEQANEKTKAKKKKSSARSNRSSKRVLSKRITSGKNAERSAKRKSAEYCLVSAVFSCTSQHPVYSECLEKDHWWNKSHTNDILAPGADTESPAKKSGGVGRTAFPDSARDSNPSVGDLDSSLKAFALRWSGENSGANDVLVRFLLHVSWYIDDVFSSETGDGVALSSCVLECFELIANRHGSRASIAPSWFGKEVPTTGDSVREIAEVISINLVNAELRLKRCERDKFANNFFEGDAICLAYMIPQLLTLSRTLTEVWSNSSSSSSYVRSDDVTKIGIRCNWLAASYNLWLGRSASQLEDIRDAETAALENIEAAIACFAKFGDKSCTVQTPHLHCPGRSGKHWRELSTFTLSFYQNELQASFVVSRARQQYQELKLDERFLAGVGEVELTSDEATIVQTVASELLGRYGVDYEGLGGKHDELVSDLLKYHNAEIEALLPSFASESETGQGEGESLPAQKWKQLWNVAALTSLQWKEMASARDVSLLTIFSACSQSRVDAFEVHASLLSGLALATLDQFEHYMMQRRGEKTASTQQHPLNDRGGADSSDGFLSDSDDDLLGGNGITNQRLETVQEDKAIFISRLFIEKLAELITTCPDVDLVKNYASSTTFRQLLHKAIILSSGKHDASSTQNELVESPPKLEALNSISYVVAAIFDKLESRYECACRELSADVFKSLVEVIVRMRKCFTILVRSKSKTAKQQQRVRRSHHQAACSTYASFIAAVGSDIARLLSLNPSVLYSDGDLQESHLISAIVSPDHHNVEEASNSSSVMPSSPTPPLQRDFSIVVKYVESLLWFWKYIINADVIGGSRDMPASHPGIVPASIIHRTTARALVVPIASSIISLCGAIGSGERSVAAQLFLSSHNKESDEFLATMSEYCDTDDSANAWFSDDDGSGSEDGSRQGGPDTLSSRCLLKMILQSVQCCGLIFSGISEKLARSGPRALFLRASMDHGPLLPVVAVRTLTKFADVLHIVFGSNQSDRRGAVWAEQYPYSTRSTGHQLDALLHKAYRCLHGFALTSQGNSPSNDLAIPVMSISSQLSSTKSYPPESTQKAAQMYRCIRRAYPTKGRRSPPKSALECVAAALPSAEETQKSKAIREFVFSRLSSPTLQSDGGDSVSSKDPESVELLPQFPSWVLSDEEEGSQNRSAVASSENTAASPSNNATPPLVQSLPVPVTADAIEEVRLVRKGICEEMAQGALPRMSGSGGLTFEVVGSRDKGQTKSESIERESTAQYEREIFEKFTAILDYLCYEPTDADSWYRLGLLLSFKADIICDRLTTPRGQVELGQSGICVPKTEPKWEELLPLEHLIEKQLDEDKTKRGGQVALLGTNLSPYIHHPWATLSSLRSCSKAVKAFCYDSTDVMNDCAEAEHRDQTVFDEIEAMFEKGDFIGWERAWGGLFVSATTDMLKKCFITAHYLSLQDKYLSDEKDELCYEVAEQFATSCYAELMGGTSYGYPMQEMTNVHRRRLARESKAFFQAAIDFAASRKLDENVHDLHFMIGKCEEKIAKTLSGEAFPQVGSESCPTGREYERMLQSALESYATSYQEMKKAERGGSLTDFQQGGSSHGFAEVTYRQHVCRLKAHIAAVRYPKECREAAEREALRISRAHWYNSPGEESAAYDPDADVRNSVWEVVADCVTAMAKLRNDNQFFHRSVYRQAMALLWAPVLCDPESGYANGSHGDIPSIKSYHIRGLNTGDGACVKSAMAVISALFDKKRPQLCGVWVATTGNPSSFEVLNDAIRKYDNLRWKYCDAYIDIMGLCRRRDVLTTFLGWVDTAQRDLPAFYDASAALGGTAPDTVHSKENLLHGSGFLWSIKRRANRTIAVILLQELRELDGDHNDAVTKRIDIFKEAYSCFLRLKAPVKDRSWKSQKVEDGAVMEVEALCRAFQDLEGNSNSIEGQDLSLNHKDKMSLLRCAIDKCEELFPALVPTRKRMKRQLSKATTTTKADDKSDEKKQGSDVPPSTANDGDTGQSPKNQSASSGQGKKKGSSSTSMKSKDTSKMTTKKSTKKANKSPAAKGDEGGFHTVDVPTGLKEGDVFEVKIDVGGGKHQIFKMKVPAGKHKKLRFRLPSKVRKKKKKKKKTSTSKPAEGKAKNSA